MTKDEEFFIEYWEKNRETAKKSFPQFLKGLFRGLLLGFAILTVISLGWYKRADMQVNLFLSPLFLGIIILIIAIFMAFLYQNYQWEMKEQQYLELLAKKRRENNNQPAAPRE